MNRRNLLKNAGMLFLAAPTLKAAAFDKCGPSVCTTEQKKPLLVRVIGPFGYDFMHASIDHHITVMAPQVGIAYKKSPHVPWLGTTSNECRFIGFPSNGPEYTLELPEYDPPSQLPPSVGTTIWQYPKPAASTKKTKAATPPMFTIKLPIPDSIIGINPTCVCLSKAPEKCTKYESYAAGTTFVYNNVQLDGVRVKAPAINYDFQPCFANDKSLPNATLDMNLTPVNTNQASHKEAKAAFRQMVSMYPWIDEDTIEFSFDPCPSSNAEFGSGADCKVCGVLIPPS